MVEYLMRNLYYTATTAFILPFLFFALAREAPGETYLVTEVTDGDSVSIKVKSFAGVPLKIERVRLIGIDAPELKQEPWGRRAKRHLKKLISESGWVVSVEFDVEQRDQHGRLLCYLWGRDGGMINEKMLGDGYAVLFTVPPNVKHAGQFAEAQKSARSKMLGIWSEGGLRESPRQWRETHPRE
ncbi:MAG TPA: thermonuclease family protein [Dissulfurispiraceae bacterium]|nr:thermonuclease family protein [Dissulfurispiraceae bacterium]